ncbi:uncharacterized protein LOC135395484 [Ornithodoros turicata]|uniref:uncharacterized protein LOC135395484 n=1 Tax=Ornithodoros turicata TaxID=34597 RepID=UPI003139EAEC
MFKEQSKVLSATISLALFVLVSLQELPVSARSTAEFVERMDKLFDTLNSSCVRQKGSKLRFAISEDSDHIHFLEECLLWIDLWHFESSRQPHTIRGWKITIRAVILLWQDMHANYGYNYLLTRRLQQEPLENLFGIVRQQHGCNENPSVLQFTAGLKHICISKLMKLSKEGNCQEDTAVMLASLASESSVSEPTAATQDGQTASLSQSTDSPVPWAASSKIVDDNVQYYVAGCLVKDFLKICPDACVCARFLKPEDQDTLSGTHQFLALLKANDVPGEMFGNITVPSDNCFRHVQAMETVFLDTIGSVCHLPNVCRSLCGVLRLSTDIFCSAACHDRFAKQYVHMRLKWHLRFVNRSLKLHKSRHSAAARKGKKLA